MFEITVRESFSAAHQIKGYRGKCEKLHGHNWEVELTLASRDLDKRGMVADFVFLRRKLKKVLAKLDHSMLNKINFFAKRNTTAEYIAYYIYRELEKLLKNQPAEVSRVKVSETDKADAVYSADE